MEATLEAVQAFVFLVCQGKDQQAQAEVKRVQDTELEQAQEALEALALAAKFTVGYHPTMVPMATQVSGPLAAWEEAVTEHGALDSATDTVKHHT